MRKSLLLSLLVVGLILSGCAGVLSSYGDKGKEGKIYLSSSSMMEAMLLSGLDAPTVEGGRSNPIPVLLRVKDLAILPNKVKANLKGCFVIAEGYGDLATERANLRLVTLSCVSKKGQSVIDQGIKGFVVDDDGKIGLKGNVVSKMGSAAMPVIEVGAAKVVTLVISEGVELNVRDLTENMEISKHDQQI